MKALGAAAVLAACVALAGCDRFGSIRSDDNATANAAAPAEGAGGISAGNARQKAANGDGAGLAARNDGAIQAGSGMAGGGRLTIDRAYMLGRWTDDEDDCDKAADFFADGRFVPASGPEGLWSLDGDRLSIVANGNTFTVQLIPVDQNRMSVINADGSLGQSTRC
ncbi:MAG TPA: hypothetical protein VLK25_13090 [Allosphingosinicella sp.]|nr:hypothetical protein [Allosphingosinicella sp.]